MRRAVTAEFLGALLLTAAVVGSGIMGERLAGGNAAIALLANTAATVAALADVDCLVWPDQRRPFQSRRHTGGFMARRDQA
jgi:metal-dependent amidase/aminoacylase/carboxypeptidase family protein